MTGIQQAIKELERRQAEIEAALRTLRGLQANLPGADKEKAKPGKRQLSPEGRARIIEAQKRRWAQARAKKK